jgi:hypothetical protein
VGGDDGGGATGVAEAEAWGGGVDDPRSRTVRLLSLNVYGGPRGRR